MLYTFLALLFIILSLVYYKQQKSKKKPKLDTLYAEALNAMVSGDSLNAIYKLKQVVKQDTNHVRAYLQLGNIIRDDNPEQALKIHQSLTVRPNLSSKLRLDIHHALAEDHKLLGNIFQARKEAEKILSIEKRNLWALKFLINISEDEKDWNSASSWTKQLNKVSGKKNTDDEARFDLYRGLDKLKNGNFEEAKSMFLKSIKTSPESFQGYLHLGDLHLQSRDLIKALDYWKKFAKNDISNGRKVYGKIEAALFDLGRYSEVENFYRKIIEIDSSNFEAIVRLANVLEEKGESSAAIDLIDSVKSDVDYDVRIDIMKLKLSLLTTTPVELGYQIDAILDKLSDINET